MTQGIIIKGVGGLYTIRCGVENFECRARGIFRNEKITPLVGDFVTAENGVITDILPRKNSLVRPPCANIDRMFIVVAHTNPEPNLYTLDKMLAIACYHKIEPVLVFNKADLEDGLGVEKIYGHLPIKRFSLCAREQNSEIVAEMRSLIKDKTVVLSGLSGVGKSTLMNLIDDGFSLQTGSVGERSRRGKHTTRHVELFETAGGRILDTPGFSNLLFEYFDIKDRSLLASCFPEFEGHTGSCRFSDCAHIKEPGCGVLEAVESGEISKSRHESYCRMYEEIGPLEEWKDK